MKMNRLVSGNTVNRLPKYIRLLDELGRQGISRVSSSEIGRLLGITPSQVRQDLSNFGTYGSQGYGYGVQGLCNGLKSVMGLDHTHRVVIVGAGSIGKALLCHLQFENYHYCVAAAFDTDRNLIGTEIGGTTVYHPDELERIHREKPIDICVLAVPAEAAKMSASIVAKMGIPAIWNLTNVDLGLNQQNIIVEDMHFLDSLFCLTYYLKEQSTNLEMFA